MAKVVLVGDSISAGYEQGVREILSAEGHEVARVGTSDTRAVLAALGEVAGLRPDVVHLNAGLHDLKTDKTTGERQVGPEEYERNLREILKRLAGETDALIIFARTTPVIDEKHNAVKPFFRYERDVELYNEIAARVTAGAGVVVNDLGQVVEDACPAKCLVHDGVHMTDEASALLARAVADAVKAALAG